VPRIVNSQGFKGLLIVHDHSEPKMECAWCQRLQIRMGPLISKLTFDLEILSQHRHLIERLQDEMFAQRSQIEEQRNSLEIMQSLISYED
jgi:hypothetical protein